jgi:hypothetical protein
MKVILMNDVQQQIILIRNQMWKEIDIILKKAEEKVLKVQNER